MKAIKYVKVNESKVNQNEVIAVEIGKVLTVTCER